MKILDNILNSLYNGSNTSIYIYIIAAFLASLLIFIIVLMSSKAKKNQKKENVVPIETAKTAEITNPEIELNMEVKPEITIPQVTVENPNVIPEISQEEAIISNSLPEVEKNISLSEKEEFSSVYIDSKSGEELLQNEIVTDSSSITPLVAETKEQQVDPVQIDELKTSDEPVITSEEEVSKIDDNKAAFEFEPVEAPVSLPETPEVAPQSLIFTEETPDPEVVVPEFEPASLNTAFSAPAEVKEDIKTEPEESYNKPEIYTNSPIVLTAEDVKAKLAKLQEKTKALHETNESLEVILKKVGLEEQASISSITDEENRLLGR